MTKSWLKKYVWLAGCLLVSLLVFFSWFQVLIRQNPDNQFTHDGIMNILSRESVVYYSDEQTPMGSFFEGLHRDYVIYDSIPRYIIQALTAAEDKNFFIHGGLDFRALIYAILDDIKSLSLKRGGSTLTQQTAKNLFPAKGRGKLKRLLAKFPELVNAYRLERNFTKEQILEFYLNQFYVSGNGHGIGIASRYFFNKSLNELNLKECAFIAGIVKGPNHYNPFLAKSPEHKTQLLTKAYYRLNYVLKQMYAHNYIDENNYKEALSDSLHFRRGTFRFSLSTNIAKVTKLLETPQMQSLLQDYGAGNYPAAGLRIYTTIHPEIQKAAQYYTAKNLSDLNIILNGYKPPPLGTRIHRVNTLKPGSFLYGVICSTLTTGGPPKSIQVQFGSSRAWVTQNSLHNFLGLWYSYQTGTPPGHSQPSSKIQKSFFNKYLRRGQPVYCAVPYVFNPDSTWVPQLEIVQDPELQGAALVLKNGKVIANVGGFDNTGYDRAGQAKRQFGSTFKPIVFAAALELGWSPLDTLLNFDQLFRLGPTFYFPNAFHHADSIVSIAWAGKHSENLASVYLLHYLLDKLDFAAFWRLAEALTGKNIHDAEESFSLYVRDSMGINLNLPAQKEIKYEQLKSELLIDLAFEGRDKEAACLKSLPYGKGYVKQIHKYSRHIKKDSIPHSLLSRCFLNFTKYNIKEAVTTVWYDSISQRYSLFKYGIPSSNFRPIFWSPDVCSKDDIFVENEISILTLRNISNRLQGLKALSFPSAYTKNNLYYCQDFRAVLALRYVLSLCRKLGIESTLDPVMSFPLGSNTITLKEAATAYQALKDGCSYISAQSGGHGLFITRIELPEGKVIYHDTLTPLRVLSKTSQYGITGILSSVVDGGTGNKIKTRLFIKSPNKNSPLKLSLPAYGKTGTTNDYRNGAFIGYVAGPSNTAQGFSPEDGYIIAVYTGFDDNRSMQRKSFTGFGGTVSLDAWIGIAQALTSILKYEDLIDFYDFETQLSGTVPLSDASSYKSYRVKNSSGLLEEDTLVQNTAIFTLKE